MIKSKIALGNVKPVELRMQLRYGVNVAESWWHFALGPQRERIWARLGEIDTRLIRIFVFDKYTPDPVKEWGIFASYVQAVLNVGAKPMITFSKFRPPYDDPSAVRWFAERCSDIVWGCIEQWGGEEVKDWYWCVWNEPNSAWVSGNFSFNQYLNIYQEIGWRIMHWLSPYLNDSRLMLGGPSVDGFQPFWFDWIWRLVNEVDDSLVSFVNWHKHGEWRAPGEWESPSDENVFAGLLMSRTRDYKLYSEAISRILKDRDILNICSKLGAHSHYDLNVSGPYNQTVFGAAYYASSLIHMIRLGVDAEMFWTATDDGGKYGLIDNEANPTPAFYAKTLLVKYIRRGDIISFPEFNNTDIPLDIVVAEGNDGHKSALIVHLSKNVKTYPLLDLLDDLKVYSVILKIDGGTDNKVVKKSMSTKISFEGYGVAVLSTNDTY